MQTDIFALIDTGIFCLEYTCNYNVGGIEIEEFRESGYLSTFMVMYRFQAETNRKLEGIWGKKSKLALLRRIFAPVKFEHAK